MYLVRYATFGLESAILIPGAPSIRLHIDIGHQAWQTIANSHFAAHPEDNEICLVTDVYVTNKVAIDHTSSPEQMNYIVNIQNTQTGEIPNNFQIRSNSPTMIVLQGMQYVFLESHMRKCRVQLEQRTPHWKMMLAH